MDQTQTTRYEGFYRKRRSLRWLFRFDVRYRRRRMHEVLDRLGIRRDGARVLDVGFGGGQMLASFPRSCSVVGADVSRSAVEAARTDAMFDGFAGTAFHQVDEQDAESLPDGPFDIVVSSHTIEHVPDDRDALAAWHRRMAPGATLVLFVPIEEPDYIEFHRRWYSVQSIVELVANNGFEVLTYERSMFINGHIWKLLTIPSRRRWPVFRHLADALRLGVLSALPYRAVRFLDGLLYRLGFGPRQALVVATRRPTKANSLGAAPSESAPTPRPAAAPSAVA